LRVVLIGVRDLDSREASLLSESAVTMLKASELREQSGTVLDRLRQQVGDLYVHIDLDVLDPAAHGRANRFASADGLTIDDVTSMLQRAARSFRIRGAALTAYDPAFDDDGRVCRAALTLVDALGRVGYGSITPQEETR
jgi:arginase